jgi:hypothetical protein
MAVMHEVVAEASEAAAAEGDEHIWWLWLDADEFHHGPGGTTIREHLASLDRRFRIVGARFFNHFPDREPASVEGRHPIEYQPLCEEHRYPMCDAGHRKHPLQRWDRGGPPITCSAGFHQASIPDGQLVEPAEAIFLHHFPYRVESVSRHRLDLLCQPSGRAVASTIESVDMHKRHQALDAVYRGDWSVIDPGRQDLKIGVHPRPWSDQVAPADAAIITW